MMNNKVSDENGIDAEPVKDNEVKTENVELKEKHIKKKAKDDNQTIGFLQLFRFHTRLDVLFMVIGFFGSIGNGAMFPLVMLFFTNIIDEFAKYGKVCDPAQAALLANSTSGLTREDLYGPLIDNMKDQAAYLCYVGLATIFFTYVQVSFWLMPSENSALCLRKNLFTSIMRQEIAWFDVYKSGELTNRLTDDVNKVKDATGDKLGNFVQYIGTFVAGVIIGLIKGWKLTLVILSLSPLLIISSYFYTKISEDMTKEELKNYAQAGAIADEVLGAIRTVFAFNGSQKEHKRYEEKLENAKILGIKKGFYNGFLLGLLWLVVFGAYGLGFWYGWTLSVETTDYTVGNILLVFFVIIIGVFSLGNAAPYISTVSTGKAAAFEIFKVIDTKSEIDSSCEKGKKLKSLIGSVEFNNIKFQYPSRKESPILKGTNLTIKPGTTNAFVGHSGCGKSTCIQLIMRYYDPVEGSVKIDGEDVKDFNINWYRGQLGVVNQEPILFGTSIKENIKFGKDDCTDEEVVEAAKNANAHNFIMELPDNYDTMVGDRGGQLSGGQKQRIAIARALIRNPKILLLDEATSALDNESEGIVQAALDQASSGRTTIVVAHRLSTIKNADVIYAFDKGVIAEYGSHGDLMNKKGIYYNLVINQERGKDETKTSAKKKSEVDPKKVELTGEKTTVATISQSSDEGENKEEKEGKEEKEENEPAMGAVFKLNSPEWHFILIGCLAAIVTGGVQPAFGIILSKSISLFSLCDVNEQKQRIDLYCSLFAAFGVITLLSNIIQSGMFGISGERLTKRLRSRAFKKMLSMEIGWFDDKENSVGVLSTKLAVETAAVQGATGVRLGFALMNIANLGVGIIIAFVYSWPITLLIIAFIPLLIIGGVFQMKALAGFAESNKSILEQAGSISNESIGNIRTVAILNKQNHFSDKYCDLLDIPHKRTIKSAHLNGFILGFTNAVMFYAMAAAFSLGAYLVQKNLFEQDIERIMLVFNCVLFGAQSVGQAAAILPDYGKAVLSIKSLFALFEREPKINNWGSEGETIPQDQLDGTIKLKQIEFTYPSRQNQKILKKIDLTIKQGQRVALVGSSGCGKSTITQLLERFYDPDEGEVTLSGKNLKDLDLYWYRNQIGIVSQEPILFDYSIKENIAYGDNFREVSQDEIIEAAKKANIHDFITKLPMGYETNCGAKGTQLSGGQKQRIAIARALVRNPKILLLDEATSALDTESEKVVQDALDKAQVGRTSIIIAHRLSTIKHCDTIFVLQNGVVTEVGTHDELMRANGFYAKLNSEQTH